MSGGPGTLDGMCASSTQTMSPCEAGAAAAGMPVPTAAEVEGHLAYQKRFHAYLAAAAHAWIAQHGLPRGYEVHDRMDLHVAPDWPFEYKDTSIISFRYHETSRDERDYSYSYLEIPTVDLLPEYGQAVAMLAALGQAPSFTR
jgi:hypothetical protein